MSIAKDKELKRTTLFLQKEAYKKLKILAIEKEMTVSKCIEEAVYDYLKKNKK